MKPQRNLGRMGQDVLSKWGHETGMIVNPSAEDSAGWDFSVQFELSSPTFGAGVPTLDMKPPMAHCLVQVKATSTKEQRESIKLSNWHHLVTSQLPTFFLVLRFRGTEVDDAFLVHVGESWMARVLKRLRELPSDKQDRLHKYSLGLRWYADDRLDQRNGLGLRAGMERAVGPDPGAYTQHKLHLLKNIGYSAAKYRWKATMTGPLDEMLRSVVDLSIGLRPALHVESFKATEVRFGIERALFSSGDAGTEMRVPGLPDGAPAVVTVRYEDGSELVEFPCSAYAPLPVVPVVPKEFLKLRFIGSYVEFVYEYERSILHAHVEFPEDDQPVPLREAAQAARLLAVFTAPKGRIMADLEVRGARQTFAMGSTECLTVGPELAQIGNAILASWTVAQHFNLGREPKASISELLRESKSAHQMVTCVEPTLKMLSMKLQVPQRPRPERKIACLMTPHIHLGGVVLGFAAAFSGDLVAADDGERPGWYSIRIENIAPRVLKRWKVPHDEWQRIAAGVDFDELGRAFADDQFEVLHPGRVEDQLSGQRAT